LANPPPRISAGESPRLRRAIFAGIAVLALLVRLPGLGDRPMHTDEAVNGYITGQILAGEGYQYDPRDRHGPALYAVAAPLARLAGKNQFSELTETSLRLGPAIVGAAMILLFATAARSIGFLAAVIAACLFAFSPLPVYYSRDFIHETFFVAATLGTLLAGWRTLTERSLIAAAWTGFGAALMLACKETAVLHFAAMGFAALAWVVSIRRFRAGKEPAFTVRALLRPLGVAAAVFGIALIVLFTWGGSHWSGISDLVRAVPNFAARASGQGHEKPLSYYVILLAGGASGALVCVLAGVGGIVAVMAGIPARTLDAAQRRSPGDLRAVRSLVVYAIAIFAVYSVIPYKTPWLALNLWLPLAALAGFGGALIWSAVNRSGAPAALRLLPAAIALTLVVTVGRDTVERVFRHAADERNPYAYAQTVEDILRLPGAIERIAATQRAGRKLRIAVIAADPWPLPWYLRRFPNAGFWQPDQPHGEAEVYLTSPDIPAPGVPGDVWRPEFIGIRTEVPMILWAPAQEVRRE